MHFYRSSFGVLGILCLVGWFILNNASEPDQAIKHSAFKVGVPDSLAGYSLARAGRGWKGVIGCDYEANTEILVFRHFSALTESELQSHIRILSSGSVAKTAVPEYLAPHPAVQASTPAVIPAYFLGAGIMLSLGFLAMCILRRTPKRHQGWVS